MTKHLLLTAIALCSAAFANAGVINSATIDKFNSPTIEHFADEPVSDSYFNFGNGMTYTNLKGIADDVKYTGPYFIGGGRTTAFGVDDDWYFAANVTGTRSNAFAFNFAAGVTRFGFHGAAEVNDANPAGTINMQFLDLNGQEIGTSSFNTAGDFFWDDFYGFESLSGPIASVVFDQVGGLVLDDVTFEGAGAAAAAVPEPASIALLGLGLAGFAVARRKPVRK